MAIINNSAFILSFILLLPACASIQETKVLTDKAGQKNTITTNKVIVDPSMGNLITRIVSIVMGKPVIQTAEAAKITPNIETKGPPKPVIESITENRNVGCLSQQKISVKTANISIHIGC